MSDNKVKASASTPPLYRCQYCGKQTPTLRATVHGNVPCCSDKCAKRMKLRDGVRCRATGA
jgi:hypothetical protein